MTFPPPPPPEHAACADAPGPDSASLTGSPGALRPGRASAPSDEATAGASPPTDVVAQPPEAPNSGIMSLLPQMGNNLLQVYPSICLYCPEKQFCLSMHTDDAGIWPFNIKQTTPYSKHIVMLSCTHEATDMIHSS